MVRKNGKGAVALLLALLMILSLVGPAVTAIAEDTGVSETEVFPEIIMEETTESQTETDVGAETLQDVEETQSLPTTEETEAFYVPETVQEEVAVIDTSRYVDAVIDGKDVQVRLMEHKDDVYEITDENIYRVTEDTRIIDEVKEYLGDRELFDIYDINYVDEDSYYRDADYTYHVVLKDVDPVKDAVLLHFMNGWEYDAVNNVETLDYQYDDEKHEVSFETKSFSPFAFVEKAEEPVDEEETVVAELPEETSEGQTIPEQEDIAVETEPVIESSDEISEEDQPGLPTEETGATDSPVETITPTVLVLDADGNHVSGVVFELFTAFISGGAPEKGDSVEQWNSTFAPYVMSDLDEDTWYCLQVVAVPDGMHITEDALYFKITEDGVKVAKEADGWTVRGEDIELLSSSAIEEVPVEEETSAVEETTDPEIGIETPTDEVTEETETLPEDTEGEPTDETDGDETDASVEETTETTTPEEATEEMLPEEVVEYNDKAFLMTERCENVLVTVRVPEKTFPVGTVMKVVPVVDENTLDAIKNSVEGDGVVKIAVAVDISFWDGETEVEPLNSISVAMISDNIAASTEAESEPVVLHVDNDNVVTEVEQKAETPDDTVMFDAGSFSVYAVVYTVEFTYDGYKYCLPGNGSILLSELLPNLGIDENVTDAISVVSSNDALLGVEAIDNDWRITSKQSFETKETLTIMFNDGAKYIIDIKDPAFVSFDDTNMTFVNANYTKYFARYATMTTLQYRDFLPENTMVVEKARIIDGVQYYTIRQILDGYHSYWILSNGVEFGLTEYDPDDIRDECLWAFYGADSDGTEFYIYNYNAQKYLTNTLTFSEEMTADTLWHCYKMPCVAMFHRDPVGSYGSWKGTGSIHSTWPNNGRDVNYIWIDTDYNGKAIAYPRNWSNDDPLKNKPSYSSLSGQASPCGRSHIFSSTMSDQYVIPSNYTVYWAYDDVSIYAENMIPASYAADGTGEADTDGVVNYTSSFFAHRYHAGLLDCYPVFVPHDGVSFTIQLNDNGGTGGSKSFKGTSDGTAITYSVDSVNIPTKDGYSFAGYYTPTYNGERIQVFDELGNMVLKGSELKGTMTLKAEWIALDVTVHYDVQGANLSAETPQPADTQTGIGLKVELPEVKDANQGIPWGQNYFLGWSLTPDGSSGLLPADFKITDEIFHEYGHDNTVTLYAIWGPQTLVIHLEQANKEWYPNEDGIESMHVDNYFTIKATDFTYHAANGMFGEWWEGTVTLPDLPEGITSYKHYTYTGRWYSLENPYVANLNFNQTMTYNYYDFYEKFVDPDKGLNEVTLSANWDADAYKIQYYVGNGYMRNDEPTIVDVTAPFTVYGSNAVAPQDDIDAKLVGWATSYESNEVIPVVNDWSNYTNTFYRQKFLDAHQWARNSENIYLAGGTYWPEDHYDDVDVDGTPIIKLYAIYASVDFDRGLINTVDSRALGWNIDLYDYDSPHPGMNDTSNIVYNRNAEAFPVVQGINRGTTGGFANPMQSFLFTGYGSDAVNIYNETRRLNGEGVTQITPNTYVAASCIQGILKNRLDEKHMPILHDGQSLAYLFNEKNETTYGGKNYTSLNHLFYQQARTLYKWGAPGSYTYPAGMDANNVTRATLDDVYADGIFLEYDSSEHYALLNKETGDFDVFAGTYDNSNDSGAGDQSGDIRLNQGIGFFPLTEPNVSRDNIAYNDYYNHHFGMHMYCNYINPTDMKITNADGSKTDMIFEFSGDDDLWVFFDDQLVLDLGGVHQPISGRINFTTGEVMIKEGYVTVGGTANYTGESSSLFVVNDPQPSLDQVVDASVLEPGTVHRVDIFFIERGGQFSNMHMLTNIIPMPAQQSVVVNKVDENGEPVVGAVMQILNSEGHVLDEWTTDSHGSHASVISVMEVSQDDGSYRSDDGSRHFAYYGETLTLHEKTAPAGYTVAEDQSFKLADNFVEMQTIYLTMVDKVAGLHVKKTWSGEGGIPVDSVEIEVYREIGSYGDFTQARVDVFDNYNFETVEGQITNTTSVRTVYLPMGTPDNPQPFTVWDKYNKWGGIVKMPDAKVTVKDMVTGEELGTAVVLLEREPYANTSGSNMYSGNDYHFLVDYQHLTQTTGTIMDIFQYGPDRDIVIELDPIALPRDTQSMKYQGVADVYTCVGGFEHWGGRDIDGPHASTDSSIYYNEHTVSQWDEVTDDEYPMTLELTADDNWEYTIPGEGFVRIAPDGRPYRYGVREKTVGNWVSTVSDPVVGGGDVTIDNEVPESNNVRIRKQTGYGNIDNYELEPWDSESEVTFPVQIFFLNDNEEYELYTGDAWYDNDNNVETDDVKQTPVQLELADGTVLDGVFYIKTSEWLVIKDVGDAVPYYVREIADSDSVFASSYTKYTSTAKSNRDDWYAKADVDYSAYDLYSVVIADEHQHYVTSTDRDVVIRNLTDYPNVPDVIKIDKNTQEPIAGAQFWLIDESMERIALLESDADGKLADSDGKTFKDYLVDGGFGQYILSEFKAPANYELSENDITISYSRTEFAVSGENAFVNDNGVYLYITNEKGTTEVKFDKVNGVTKESLAGAVLQILDADKNVLYEWTSDGTVYVAELGLGATYTLHEKTAPEGYAKADDIKFTVSADGVVTVDDEEVEVVVMKDYERISLPSTGSTTSIILMVVGAIVIVGGGLFLLLSKRKKDDEDDD